MSTRSSVAGPARSRARPCGGAGRDLGEDLADVGRRDRLHQQRGHGGAAVALGPADHHLGELVELGGREDRVGDRAGRDELLLAALAGVVGVPLDAVDADDRQQHVVAHAGALLGGEQALGHRAERRPRALGVLRRRVGHVDDGLGAGKGVVEALAGGGVDPPRAGDDDGLVPGPLEGGDGVPTHEPRPADHRDAHVLNIPSSSRCPIRAVRRAADRRP